MGFRTGAFAKVWEVTPMSDTSTKLRMSISRKKGLGSSGGAGREEDDSPSVSKENILKLVYVTFLSLSYLVDTSTSRRRP